MAIITFPNQPKISFKRFEFKVPAGLTSWSKSAQSDKYFLAFLFVWSLAILLTLVTILLTFSLLPSQIPLFYSRIWGEQQLAAKEFIYLPLIGSGLLGLFNITLSVKFHSLDRVMAYLLIGTASLIAVLSAITVISIVRLLI